MEHAVIESATGRLNSGNFQERRRNSSSGPAKATRIRISLPLPKIPCEIEGGLTAGFVTRCRGEACLAPHFHAVW